jgi:hypothetical protein
MEKLHGAEGKHKKLGTLSRKNMDFCSKVLNLICQANLSHFSHIQKTYLIEITNFVTKKQCD